MTKNEANVTLSEPKQQQQQQRKVIFSFTSYAKDVISALKSSTTVHVAAGLTPAEISAVEAAAGVAFPADLRSILAEGMPVGPGFPNWVSSSRHQLRLLAALPVLSLVKEVSRNGFWWGPRWGPRPRDDEAAVAVAREFLAKVPRLIPVFRHCYVPCEPTTAGNPVFYVHGGDVILLSSDVSEFYKTTDFFRTPDFTTRPLPNPQPTTSARNIEFWSEVAEHGGRPPPLRWWQSIRGDDELGECMEAVVGRLRDGGWAEDDVREMMMMDDDGGGGVGRVRDGEGVVRHVRRMSKELLRGGWSLDDVVYSLGEQVVKGDCLVFGYGGGEGDTWVVDINHVHSSNHNSLVLSR